MSFAAGDAAVGCAAAAADGAGIVVGPGIFMLVSGIGIVVAEGGVSLDDLHPTTAATLMVHANAITFINVRIQSSGGFVLI